MFKVTNCQTKITLISSKFTGLLLCPVSCICLVILDDSSLL